MGAGRSLDSVLAEISSGGSGARRRGGDALDAVLGRVGEGRRRVDNQPRDASPASAPGGIPAAPAGVRVELPDIESGRVSRFATAAAATIPSLGEVLKGVVAAAPPVQAVGGIAKGVQDYSRFIRTGVAPEPVSATDAVEMFVGPVREMAERVGSGDVAGGVGQAAGYAAQAIALAAGGKAGLRRAAPAGPGLDSVLTRVKDWRPSWSGAMDVFKAGERVRLPAMVSNIGTAVRNAISQGATYGTHLFEDAVSGAVQAARGTPLRSAFAPAVEDVAAVRRAVTRSGRGEAAALREQVPEAAKQLTEAPAGDVSMTDRVATTLGFFNSVQEKFWRNLAFDAHVRGELRARRLTPETAPPEVLSEVAGRGVEKALELTFAKDAAAGTAASAVMGAYEKFPLLRLVQPFPRFVMNSMNWVGRHSPAGFFSPKTWKEFAAGNPRRAVQAAEGTALLAAATAYRAREDAPEQWYLIDLPSGRQVDVRPFQPFGSYFFLGEVVNDVARADRGEKTRLRGSDYAASAVGLNRISGTGLSIVDALLEQREPLSKAGTAALQTAGSYVGGFLAPLAQFRDAVAQFSEAERKIRDTSSEPFWGNALRNVPGALRSFPTIPAVTRPGDLQRENPLIGQLTGVNLRSRTPVEQELDRLRIKRRQVAPRIYSEHGRLTAEIMGETLPGELEAMISDPDYQRLGDAERLDVVLDRIRSVRRQASRQAAPARVVK